MKETLFKYLQIASVLVLSVYYLFLTINHAVNVNTTLESSDQLAYLTAVKKIHENNFWYLGDRNRMPLYPYIQSIFYNPGLSDSEAFLVGKYVNIFISLACLYFLYKLVKKYFDNKFSSAVFVIISALGFFIYKAPYYQVEILFYTLFLYTFIYWNRLINNPSPRLALKTGLISGLAYLTKGTVLLGVVLAILTLIFKLYLVIYESLIKKILKNYKARLNISKGLITIFVFLTAFLIPSSPYLSENKKIFGKYFYNVGTNFYIWYDSWSQVEEGTKAYGDRIGWPNMPEENIPSLRRYLRTHSPRSIVKRLQNGILITVYFVSGNYYSSRIFIFPIIYFGFFIWIVFKARTQTVKVIRKFLACVVFSVVLFIAYFLAISWFSAIQAPPRFILTLWLPALFGVFFFYEKFKDEKIRSDLRRLHVMVIIFLIVWFKIAILPTLAASHLGG